MRSLPALILTATLLSSPSTARSDWITDPGPEGLLVFNGALFRAVVSDGAGGALLGFGEYYGNNNVLSMRVQKVDAQGQIPWGAAGVTVGIIGFLVSDYGPWMATDGSGGAIVVWRAPSNQWSPVHGMRVSAGGQLLWTPTKPGEGLFLANPDAITSPIWVGQDGAGSFITVWYQGSTPALWAQRFDVNGTTFWGANGVSLTIETSSPPGIVGDGSGGLIVAWSAIGALGDRDVFAQRFGRDGTPRWATGGIPICTAIGDQGSGQPGISITSDGASGAIIAWLDRRTDSQGDVYAQRVDASGAAQWMAGGIPLCTAAGAQARLAAVPDGIGGSIVAWEDTRSGDLDLYAQRVSLAGNPTWIANGAPFVVAPGSQFGDQPQTGPAPYLAPDGTGGVFAAWTDSRTGSNGNDIYSQHLDGSGIPTWPVTGLLFGANTLTLGRPGIMPDGAGGCAVFWGSGFELRGRGSSGALVGVEPPRARFGLRARPTPSAGPLRLEFSLPEPGRVRIEAFDLAGRLVGHRELELSAGTHTMAWESLGPGLYFVRIRQGAREASVRAVVIR